MLLRAQKKMYMLTVFKQLILFWFTMSLHQYSQKLGFKLFTSHICGTCPESFLRIAALVILANHAFLSQTYKRPAGQQKFFILQKGTHVEKKHYSFIKEALLRLARGQKRNQTQFHLGNDMVIGKLEAALRLRACRMLPPLWRLEAELCK